MGSYAFAQIPFAKCVQELDDPFVICNFEEGTPTILLSTTPPNGWGYNGSPSEITGNPDKSGINMSSTVMRHVRNAGTGVNDCAGTDGGDVNWSGPKLQDESGWTAAFTIAFGWPITGYNYMHVKMYCNQVIQPAVSLCGGDVWPMGGTIITPDTWIDVVFDISSCAAVDRIWIMIDKTCPMTKSSEVYLDDIILTNNPVPITTGINNVRESDVSVFAVNGALHISGSSDAVAVYNVLGRLVYQNTSAENLSVELAKGLYIVRAGAVIKKILIQ